MQPKLRFPEFSGNWTKSKLSLCTNYVKGYAFKTTDFSDSGVRVIRVSDLGVSAIRVDQHDQVFISVDRLKEFNKWSLKADDIVITTVGSKPHLKQSAVGRAIYIVEDNYVLNQNLVLLRTEKQIISYFLFSCFQRIEYENYIEVIQRGNANQSNITMDDLLDYEVVLAETDEQTKIADFLSIVDKKITLLEQQQQAWQSYKQGMIQKLFSGEVRFKDENGKDFPEWVEMEIGHLLIKNSEKNRDGKIQVIDSISNKYGFVEQNEVFEDRRVASKDLSNYYVIREKCFAYNPSRIDVGSLAYQTKSRVSVISPLYISFYTNKLIDDKFLYAWLFCQKFIRQMNQSFEGSVRNTLSYDSLSKIIIDLPHLEEQKKIADYLSGLDDKINAITQQLEQMREWKKGLLQQMFV